MQSTNEKNIPDDELDLRSIGAKLYSFISYPFVLLFSNILTTVLFIIAGILLAVSLKYLIPKNYTSSFIILPIDRNERLHLKIIRDIQTLLKFKDYTALSEELKLDSLVIRKISGLQAFNSSLKNSKDSVNSTEVVITTTDFNLFIPVQTALLNYLESNPYFAKIKGLQKKQIELELTQLEKDIVNLDSLKAMQLKHYSDQKTGGQNGIPLNELINPIATYTVEMERINRKSALLSRMAFLDNFQLIKPCPVVRNHTSPPRILYMCFYTIPAFLVLYIIFLHLRIRRKKTA